MHCFFKYNTCECGDEHQVDFNIFQKFFKLLPNKLTTFGYFYILINYSVMHAASFAHLEKANQIVYRDIREKEKLEFTFPHLGK